MCFQRASNPADWTAPLNPLCQRPTSCPCLRVLERQERPLARAVVHPSNGVAYGTCPPVLLYGMGIGSLEAPLAEPLENHATADAHTNRQIDNRSLWGRGSRPQSPPSWLHQPSSCRTVASLFVPTRMDSTKRMHFHSNGRAEGVKVGRRCERAVEENCLGVGA